MRNPTRTSSLLSWAILLALAVLIAVEVIQQVTSEAYPGVPAALELRLPLLWR